MVYYSFYLILFAQNYLAFLHLGEIYQQSFHFCVLFAFGISIGQDSYN